MKRAFSALRLALALALAGFFTACAPSLTNLTSKTIPRTPSGVYPFEVIWASRDATIRTNTLQPFVVVGLEKYPMRRSPLLPDRWEAAVPVGRTNQFVNYRFKFDYLYNAIGQPKGNSRLSPPYQLQILDR